MKLEVYLMRNFGDRKITSTLLATPFITSVRCKSTSAAPENHITKLFLPIFKTIYNKLSDIMMKETSPCRLLYKLEWRKPQQFDMLTSSSPLPLVTYNNDNNKETTNLQLNIDEIFILFFLKHQKLFDASSKNSPTTSKMDYKSETTVETENESKIYCDACLNSQENPNLKTTNTKFVVQNYISICNASPLLNLMEQTNQRPPVAVGYPMKAEAKYQQHLLQLNRLIMQDENYPQFQPPPEKKRKKKKKKSMVNSQNHCTDRVSIDNKQKKRRKKLKKRQRNHNRDTKQINKYGLDRDDDGENITDETTVCISLRTLPPSTPLPAPFLFTPINKRQRHLSECSNDSLEICFMEEDSEDDETEDCDNEVDGLKTYCKFYRSDETDSDSGLLDEKRVRFNLKPEIHVMRTWDYAHRQARKGHWEQIGRDRVRFQDRIRKMESVISPVLDEDHRNNIFCKYSKF